MANNPQSVQNGPSAGIQFYKFFSYQTDYWQRIFSEDVPGIRDQVVAKDTCEWMRNTESMVLPQKLFSEDGYASRFEKLILEIQDKKHPLFLSGSQLRLLTEQVHSILLEQYGNQAGDDDKNHAAIVLWRSFSHRSVIPDDHLDWLKRQASLALKCSLRFANYIIEHCWGDKIGGQSFEEDIREHIDLEVCRKIKNEGSDWLVHALSPSWPFLLWRILRSPSANDLYKDGKITNIVNELIAKCDDYPDTIIPQLAYLFFPTSPNPMKTMGEEDDVYMHNVPSLDKDYLQNILPDVGQQAVLMRVIATDRSYPKLKDNFAKEMRLTRNLAIEWLNNTGRQ